MKHGSPFLDAGVLPRVAVALVLTAMVWVAVMGVMQ